MTEETVLQDNAAATTPVILKVERRGRPKIVRTAEQEADAKSAARARLRAKCKNITVDADLVLMLQDLRESLAAQFHFEPTISQVLRYLIVENNSKNTV